MQQKLIKLLHWVLILTLVQEFLYASYMIFFVVKPDGVSGPLLNAARSIPFELMVTRRLYALEAWISFGALAIYLGITVIYPRFKKDYSK